MAILFHDAGRAEPDEAADPDLAKMISYLTLATRDRQCLAQLRPGPKMLYEQYSACMHENKDISYCQARPIDFEELAVMMGEHMKLRRLLPLDRLVRHISSQCIEVDGFVPPSLPLVAIERPGECYENMPVLLAYAVRISLKELTEEHTEKRSWCNSNRGLAFLADECVPGARGLQFAGHEGFCRWPIKRPQKDIQ